MKNKTLWVTTVICLLPLLYGLFQYRYLPMRLPTHFDPSGQVNGYLPKTVVLICLPIFFALLNIFVVLRLQKTSNNQTTNKVLYYLGQWLLPILGNLAVLSFILLSKYPHRSIAFGVQILVALLWIIIGNYLPKTAPNRSMGIRLPWTLKDPNNWQKTHHFAGILFVIAGCFLLLLGLVQQPIHHGIFLLLVGLTLILPTLYSYYLASTDKNQHKLSR